MPACKDYLEQISALADGQLEADEKAQLEAHLRSCPRCQSTYALFAKLHPSAAEAPPELKDTVMARVRAAGPVPAPKKKHLGQIIRWGALAACLALVIFAGLRFLPSFDSSGRDMNMAPMESKGDMAVSDDCLMTSNGSASGDASEDAQKSSDGAMPNDNLPDSDAYASEEFNSAAPFPDGASLDAPASEELPPAPGSSGDNMEVEIRTQALAPDAYAVVYLSGQLPQELKEVWVEDEAQQVEEGVYLFYISAELFDTLAAQGYEVEYLSSGDAQAAVLYTPDVSYSVEN